MDAKRWTTRLACGLALLTAAGCYSAYPYGAQGPGGYPGYGAPPANSLGPGTTVPPGQGPTFQPGTSYIPGGTQTYQPQQLGAQPQQWQQSQSAQATDPNGSGGSFESNSDNFQEPSTGNSVPEYEDPNSFNGGSAFESGGDGFSMREQPQAERQGLETEVAMDGPSLGPAPGQQSVSAKTVVLSAPVDEASSSTLQNDPFVDPVPLTPVSTSAARPASTSNNGSSQDRPNPYDFDRAGYRWLRGVVDYDAREKTWNIIYDLNPEPNDEYGGSMTLIDDPRLDVLQNEDVVLIEGQIDPNTRDRFGKPRYRVAKVNRLVPAAR